MNGLGLKQNEIAKNLTKSIIFTKYAKNGTERNKKQVEIVFFVNGTGLEWDDIGDFTQA